VQRPAVFALAVPPAESLSLAPSAGALPLLPPPPPQANNATEHDNTNNARRICTSPSGEARQLNAIAARDKRRWRRRTRYTDEWRTIPTTLAPAQTKPESEVKPSVRTQLEAQLIAWHRSAAVQARRWSPILFWAPHSDGTPYGRLKVDARELEVLLATIVGEPSRYLDILDNERDGRGSFIAANARRHELPLLTRLTPPA